MRNIILRILLFMYAVDSISADSNYQGEPYFNVTFNQKESALTKGSPTLESNHLVHSNLDPSLIYGCRSQNLVDLGQYRHQHHCRRR